MWYTINISERGDVQTAFEQIVLALRQGADHLLARENAQRSAALIAVAQSINSLRDYIIQENAKDVVLARKNGLSEEMIDRLLVDDRLIDQEIASLEEIASYADPIGGVLEGWTLENGLQIRKTRFPLGVVALIYESRPAVTVDAFALAYKSANAILLRGSKTARHSNAAFLHAIKQGLEGYEHGVPGSVALMPGADDHSDVDRILSARGLVDCVIPRGGRTLIENVVLNAKVPVIETGAGVCHLYVDAAADIDMALDVAENAKLSRPSVCNALECIVIHEEARAEFLPKLLERFEGRCKVLLDEDEANFGVEFLAPVVAIKTVGSLEQAVRFVNAHNTKHSESIITRDEAAARYFQQHIDAACVYVNASTRFTDGGQFGFGAEWGISTQKLHVRGPMGIEALTTYKYLLDGDGQIRA